MRYFVKIKTAVGRTKAGNPPREGLGLTEASKSANIRLTVCRTNTKAGEKNARSERSRRAKK